MRITDKESILISEESLTTDNSIANIVDIMESKDTHNLRYIQAPSYEKNPSLCLGKENIGTTRPDLKIKLLNRPHILVTSSGPRKSNNEPPNLPKSTQLPPCVSLRELANELQTKYKFFVQGGAPVRRSLSSNPTSEPTGREMPLKVKALASQYTQRYSVRQDSPYRLPILSYRDTGKLKSNLKQRTDDSDRNRQRNSKYSILSRRSSLESLEKPSLATQEV